MQADRQGRSAAAKKLLPGLWHASVQEFAGLQMNTIGEILIALRSSVVIGFWFLVVGGSLLSAVWLFS